MNIILSKISKSYNNHKVLTDISLTIKDQNLTTLLGLSGCGKTTLLRIISGLEIPDSGTIHFDDKLIFSKDDNVNIPPEERQLGFVFQDFALWPHMSVFENVAFGLRATNQTKDLKEKVLNALSAVQLKGLEQRFPNQLSGGQQQRVAFARALAISPKCILFDEPLSALDAILREQMRVELKQLVKKNQITSVFVTHDQIEAMSISDEVVIMNEGEILQHSSSEEIYNNPNSLFIAKFIGKSNWIDEQSFFRPQDAYLKCESDDDLCFETKIIDNQFLGETRDYLLSYKNENWTFHTRKTPTTSNGKLKLYVNKNDIKVI